MESREYKVNKRENGGGGVGQQQPLQAGNKPPAKLYCYESLMLKFDVPFPLSLIFTQKSIVCYQLLFR